MEISNSTPTPSTPAPTGAGNATPAVTTPSPTPSKPEKVVKVPEAKAAPVKLTPAQTSERIADIEAKVSGGGEVSKEDLLAFESYQALEAEKLKQEAKAKEGNSIIEDAPAEDATEEISEEAPEEEAAHEIPEDYKEIFELTGAKNPKQVAESIKDYRSKIQFALDWKSKADAQFKEKDQAIQHRETALENQTELLAGVLMGDQEAIEHARSILSQAGKNVHKPMEMPGPEKFVDQESYDLFKKQQDELVAIKARLDQKEAKDKESVKIAEERAARKEMVHSITMEVSTLCEKFSDFGISAAQARAMLDHRLKTGKTPEAFAPILKLMEFADKKGLTLEEAYKLSNYDKVATGVSGKVKSEVKKILDPRKNQQPQPGLSGVNPKAPPAPGGKYTRDQVLNMANTSKFPDAWMMKLSDGSSNLDPNKIPAYVSAILEDLH